jgi:hypothetical protein
LLLWGQGRRVGLTVIFHPAVELMQDDVCQDG